MKEEILIFMHHVVFFFLTRLSIARRKKTRSYPLILFLEFRQWWEHKKHRLKYEPICVNGIEPHLPTGPIIEHNGKKKNIANIHEVSTKNKTKIYLNKSFFF